MVLFCPVFSWFHVLVLRAANLAMSVLFLFSAGLQLNDPDPAAWVAIYGAAAAACGWMAMAPARRLSTRMLPLAVALTAFVWAGLIAARAAGLVELPALFESWEMKDAAVEETREMYGLLIVGVWISASVAASSLRRN